MIEKALLISSFLIFLSVALEAKVRSRLGFFIVTSGLVIGLINLAYVLLSFVG